MSKAIARESFKGKRDGHGVVGQSIAQVTNAKGQGGRPIPEITIDGVVWFQDGPVVDLIIMSHAAGPVFVKAIVNAAANQTGPRDETRGGIEGRIVSHIEVA